jgi:sugar/nucleoside kinase (ribokinase family)
MQTRKIAFSAFCNPLMDIITHTDQRFLEKIGARAGTMNLVDVDKADEILRHITTDENRSHVSPGGSGANTSRGFAWLNQDAALPPPMFFGATGDDELGSGYLQKLEKAGVLSGLVRKKERTGFSVIAVTPDGERTMFTCLGACRLFSESDVDFGRIAESAVLHLTGYMWDTENQRRVAERAAEEARRAGTLVSLDLADPFVVTRYRDVFLKWIPGQVDLLFGNRDEFALLSGNKESDESILDWADELAPLLVMKVGARGAYVAQGGKKELVPALAVKVLDTTGAGDSFAGAFLYGRLKGLDPVACARLGNRLASSIVTVAGCSYEALDRTKVTGVMV